jgi:hypothetical protein
MLVATNDEHDLAHADSLRAAEVSICASWDSTFPDSHSEDEESDGESPVSDIEDADDHIFDWDRFGSGTGLSAWDELGEGYERDTANIGESRWTSMSFCCSLSDTSSKIK